MKLIIFLLREERLNNVCMLWIKKIFITLLIRFPTSYFSMFFLTNMSVKQVAW